MRSVRGPNLAGVGGVGFRHRRRCDQRQDDPCHPPGPSLRAYPRWASPRVVRLNLKRSSDFGDCMVNALVPTPVVPRRCRCRCRCRCLGAACAPGGPNGGSPFNIANSRVGKASWYVPRPRPRRSPVAPCLVHPGDPSCGVMTGHPVWLHAVVKTAELRTIRP